MLAVIHWLVHRFFSGLHLVLAVIYLFDGPIIFGTEPLILGLEPLLMVFRLGQVVVLVVLIWGLLTERQRAHVVIASILLGLAILGALARFLPGAFGVGR